MKFLLKAIQLLEWFERAPRGLLLDLRCGCAMSLGRELEWFILSHPENTAGACSPAEKNKLMPIIRR